MDFEFDEVPTQTEQTKQEYQKRVKSMRNRACKDLNLSNPYDLDPRQLAAWLISKKPSFTKKTFGLYKSALVYVLKNDGDDDSAEAADFLIETNRDGCAEKTTKTSSTKLKKLPDDDFQKLKQYLLSNKGKWHVPLVEWLRSGMITGVRPQEWSKAEWHQDDGEAPRLILRNAKATNGRAHGETRTIVLTDVPEEDAQIIKRHLDRVRTWTGMGQYGDFYAGCSFALYHVSRKLWPRRTKHVTLYSARHQFTANAKSSGRGLDEIAAMMGHAVDTTASRHYGRRAAGEEQLLVNPVEDEVARIRRKFEPSPFQPDLFGEHDSQGQL